mmetsp:Transcript_35025/g.54602  ORF Transcript_35025/g.54602 Transcript_35025/m.54602 type:complete len:319 (-) Transcript_35025:93-1049(-)
MSRLLLFSFALLCLLVPHDALSKKELGENEIRPLSDIYETLCPTCPRCAVVFNSGTLLKHENGPVIDSYKYIIRFNGGVLNINNGEKDFRKNVGTKTDLVYSHGGALGAVLANENRTYKVISEYGVKSRRVDEAIEQYPHLKGNLEEGRDLIPYDNLKECRIYFVRPVVAQKACRCSSGAKLILYSRNVCSSITIFGMEEDPAYPDDFWDPFPDRKEGELPRILKPEGCAHEHDFLYEHEIINQLTCESSFVYQYPPLECERDKKRAPEVKTKKQNANSRLLEQLEERTQERLREETKRKAKKKEEKQRLKLLEKKKI